MVNDDWTGPSRHELAKARRLLAEAAAQLELIDHPELNGSSESSGWMRWLRALRSVDTLRAFMPRVIPDLDKVVPATGEEGFTPEPGDHPVDQYSARAMDSIKQAFAAEFGEDELSPHVTLVCAMPPDGRVAIATTEGDPDDALEALKAGWGAIHRAQRLGAG